MSLIILAVLSLSITVIPEIAVATQPSKIYFKVGIDYGFIGKPKITITSTESKDNVKYGVKSSKAANLNKFTLNGLMLI